MNLKKRKTSVVWNHFDFSTTNRAKCHYCQQELSFTRGSTGNLMRHIRLKHALVPPKVPRKFSSSQSSDSKFTINESNADGNFHSSDTLVQLELHPTATNSFPTIVPISCAITTSKSNENELTNYNQMSESHISAINGQIMRMIIKDFHPFSIIDDTEFRKLIQLLCPEYVIPAKKTFSNDIMPTMYNETVEQVKLALNHITTVALSTEAWVNYNKTVMAVVAHVVNEDVQTESWLLGCHTFYENFTTVEIKDFLKTIITQWGLDNKIVAVTTSDANISLAVEQCGWRQIKCFAHDLNSIGQTSLQAIQPVLGKIKNLVEHLQTNVDHLEKLWQIQEEMGLAKLKFKQDLTTWRAIYESLVRLHKNKKPIIMVLGIFKLDKRFVTSEDWIVIHQVIRVLSVFNAVTTELSSETSIPLSKIIVLSSIMIRHVNKISSETDLLPPTLRMCDALKNALLSAFMECEKDEILAESLILDPRFKVDGFVDKENFLTAFESLKQTAATIQLPVEVEVLTSTSSTTNTQEDFSIDLYSEFKKERETSQPLAAAIYELNIYLADDTISVTQDPLVYWKDNQIRFPRLFQVMKRYFCVPANSVPCQRMFLKAGNVLVEKRSRLKLNRLNEYVFLNHNLKFG